MDFSTLEVCQSVTVVGICQMFVALKVDVDTLRGTVEGVPALLKLFAEFEVKATFLFSLGPDHTGRAIKRVFRPGFLSKVGRTSVTSHYGLKTLMYGTLLPGPHIGRKAGEIMRQVRDAGHETGIHCHDHVRWQDNVAKRDREWTMRELGRAVTAYREVFSEPALVHGAAGWQINADTPMLEQELGFHYASDTRGKTPYMAVTQSGVSSCIQIPTTLPTLDELIGVGDIDEDNVHEHVFMESQMPVEHGHVYTLHAELEGMKLLPVLEKLLIMWQGSQRGIGPVSSIFNDLNRDRLPRHHIAWSEVPGRSGKLAVQGPPAGCKPDAVVIPDQ